MLTTLLLPLL
jgi:hypothetical protein